MKNYYRQQNLIKKLIVELNKEQVDPNMSEIAVNLAEPFLLRTFTKCLQN
jgi:hypothetical protein